MLEQLSIELTHIHKYFLPLDIDYFCLKKTHTKKKIFF